ncbi:MAG: helix-turn-helix domain-containing protein [Candidatus Binatia bacterium]
MSNGYTELRLLTLGEAAACLQVSKRTLLRMIQFKKVPAFKVGGQWRIRESRFTKWLGDKENSDSSSR